MIGYSQLLDENCLNAKNENSEAKWWLKKVWPI